MAQATTAVETRTANYLEVNIDQVSESKTNPRKHFAKDALLELTNSVREKGVLVPLLVRPAEAGFEREGFEIIAGARRYRAAKAAGLATIPILVRELDDEQALEVQVIENLQRADVHPLEEAEGYKQLLAKGKYSIESLADKVGKSTSYVYQRLKLAELIEPAKKVFLEDRMTAGHAIQIARLQPEQQKTAVAWLKRDGVSVRELSRSIDQEFHLDLGKAAFPTANVEMFPAVGACTTCPKRTGNAPQLFDDITKGDTCTDPNCFHAKERAFVKIQLGMHPEAVMLTAGYVSYGKEPKGQKDWHPAGNKKCEHTKQGVIVESDREETPLGKLLMVCTKHSRCKIHNEYARPSGSGASVSASEKKRREKEKLDQKVEGLALTAIVAAARKGKAVDVEDLRLVASTMIDGVYQSADAIAAGFQLKGHTELYSDKWIKKLSTADCMALLLGVALSDYSAPPNGVRDAAKRHGVDLDKLRKQASLQTSAKAGVCRICKCTEKRACRYMTQGGKVPVSCSWTDDAKTLCNNPKCVKAAAKKAAA